MKLEEQILLDDLQCVEDTDFFMKGGSFRCYKVNGRMVKFSTKLGLTRYFYKDQVTGLITTYHEHDGFVIYSIDNHTCTVEEFKKVMFDE